LVVVCPPYQNFWLRAWYLVLTNTLIKVSQWVFQTCKGTATDLRMLLFTQYKTTRVLPLLALSLSPCIQWRSQPQNLEGAKKFGGPKCLILGNNTILFGKTPLKAQNDCFLKMLWGAWPLLPTLATPIAALPANKRVGTGGPHGLRPPFSGDAWYPHLLISNFV